MNIKNTTDTTNHRICSLGGAFFTTRNRLLKWLLLIFPMVTTSYLSSQELVRFEVYIPDNRIDAPVTLSLDALAYNPDQGGLALYELSNGEEVKIPAQLEQGTTTRLWFILNGRIKGKTTRKYVLRTEENTNNGQVAITLEKQHKNIVVKSADKNILGYQFDPVFPPEGTDILYKRSGFIHPVVSPGGEILSRIQPPDHYHHYGIWGPWTLTKIDGREVDFWNLAKGQGTVQFGSFISTTEGVLFGGFKAHQEHIDFGSAGADNIAINETLEIKSWNVNSNVWMIDYTTNINTPLTNGILLEAYRYGGGIGFRATEKWNKDNCTVLTSEGKSRIDADGSNARWCIVEGESDTKEGRSGILFLSHPSNRMHPEPMRVWPVDANKGRGDMFFEFTPIRNNDWQLEKNQDYTLKYRMIVFDGKIDVQTAEEYWNAFAKLPQINFNTNK